VEFIYTDGSNPDFIELCRGLDDFLNDVSGGEEKRSKYIQYNMLKDINDAIVVYHKNLPIGCASFKKYDSLTAEVKRVFIKEEFRGRGISKFLMAELEKHAKIKGYKYLILETGEPLVNAMALYRSIGYEITPNYGKYADMPESICMKKGL